VDGNPRLQRRTQSAGDDFQGSWGEPVHRHCGQARRTASLPWTRTRLHRREPTPPSSSRGFRTDDEPDAYEDQRCRPPRRVGARVVTTPIYEQKWFTVAAERPADRRYLRGRNVGGIVSVGCRHRDRGPRSQRRSLRSGRRARSAGAQGVPLRAGSRSGAARPSQDRRGPPWAASGWTGLRTHGRVRACRRRRPCLIATTRVGVMASRLRRGSTVPAGGHH
jgi:hypothetical protein